MGSQYYHIECFRTYTSQISDVAKMKTINYTNEYM